MNSPAENSWQPDPQVLAAYFDGEFEGRDDVADLRARIESWLESHPEAAAEWARHQQLKNLWLETTPADPRGDVWSETRRQIDAKRRRAESASRRSSRSRSGLLAAGVFAASVALFVALLISAMRAPTPETEKKEPLANTSHLPIPQEEVEVFPVALGSEVNILRVEGDDLVALVVGQLPMEGPMELAPASDISIKKCCPQTRIVQTSPERPPMVWARLETD